MLHLICTLQVLGFQAGEALSARADRRDDRGQTAAEYLGIIVILGGIIVLIGQAKLGTDIVNGIKAQITKILGA